MHAIGLVKPDDLNAKFKFFAAEESAEIAVSSSTYTETVLPRCREGETMTGEMYPAQEGQKPEMCLAGVPASEVAVAEMCLAGRPASEA